jgi:DNA (cytosine-5)-methyltransferase 1
MGIDWMTRDELNEAIPPAYTEHVGLQLMAHLTKSETASSADLMEGPVICDA